MSFPEQQEDKIVTFALSPKDYWYELKLAKFLYKIDKIEGPTIEDLAVWCHNFAIGALSRQLGQLYVVSSKKSRQEIQEDQKNLLPDFEKVLPNPLITPVPRPNAQVPPQPKYEIPLIDDVQDESQKIVEDVQKEIEEWIKEQ